MDVTFKLDNPNEACATLSISMTVRKWRDLKDQLDTKYPSWELASAISRVIRLAESKFDAEHKS